MSISNIRKFIQDNRGSLYIEFLLTLPIIMTILFGVLEIGSVVFDYFSILTSFGYGLRQAASEGYVSPNVISKMKDIMKFSTMDPANITISGTPAPVTYNSDIVLTVEYTHEFTLMQYLTITSYSIPINISMHTTSDNVIR